VQSDIRVPSFQDLERTPVPLSATIVIDDDDPTYSDQVSGGGCGGHTIICGDTGDPGCGINTQVCQTNDHHCMTIGCFSVFCTNECETYNTMCQT
jgi:hypothetical protein